MNLIDTFGSWVGQLALRSPDQARRLLLTGYRALNLVYRLAPQRFPFSRCYAAKTTLNLMIRVLSDPDQAAMVSLFTPCEPLLAAGITPYSVEALSCYLMGTHCERVFLETTEKTGIPETLCSYHRTFLGAAENGIMPKPRFIIYTNLACDGNMLTFPYLKQKFNVPSFFINVPYEKNEDSVCFVAEQLRQATCFIQDLTGKEILEDHLIPYTARSRKASEDYAKALRLLSERRIPESPTDEMYKVLLSHILLGSPESEKYFRLFLEDAQHAPLWDGLRLIWLHTIPYEQPAVKTRFGQNPRAFLTACDLAYESLIPYPDADPYRVMAKRMVFSCFNGSLDLRMEYAKKAATLTGADGAVLFAHWGCKNTLGSSRLIKQALEESGLLTLVLDGDGCDPANNSDGQMATRLDAFLELLEGNRQ